MKKPILILILITLFVSAFSQLTPSKNVRVSSSTTPFNENVSIGTIIFDNLTKKTYSVILGQTSTKTISTCVLDTDIRELSNVPTNLSYTASLTTGELTSSTGLSATVPFVTDISSGLMIPSQKAKLDGDADQSATNEGSLTVSAGTSTTAIINSNTNGSAEVTIEAGTGLSIAESGNVITIANTQVGLTDGSITYARLSTQMTGKNTVTSAIDYSANGIGEITLQSNTTFTFSNLQLNKTFKLKVTTAGYTITLPAYCKAIGGSQPLTGNTTFYFYFDAWNVGSGTENILFNAVKLQ